MHVYVLSHGDRFSHLNHAGSYDGSGSHLGYKVVPTELKCLDQQYCLFFPLMHISGGRKRMVIKHNQGA